MKNSIQAPTFRGTSRWLSCFFALLLLTFQQNCTAAEPPKKVHRVRFCGFGGDENTIRHLQQWWPNIEYCLAYDSKNIEGMARLALSARQVGATFSLQAAGPVLPEGYLDLHQNWAIDFLNRKPPDLGSGHPLADYCHPATVAALRENLDTTLRKVKADSLSMVDFVWPWVGGSWGYSPACISAYREILAEADEGLRLSIDDSVGDLQKGDLSGTRTIHFWDYFQELSGLRFKPADLGYTSWQHYQPLADTSSQNLSDAEKRNIFVFRGLIHYCWLRYAQSGAAHARQLGGELQASLNPENSGNGTDLLTWSRLADTGEPWWEQWGSPWTAVAGYHTYGYFTQPHRGGTKRFGLIGETGAAGGHPADVGFGPARPHYWDPNSNYAITWAISAAGQFDDREEDYIYASPLETEDPSGPHYDSWRGYVKGMDGFFQYSLDQPQRSRAQVVSITNRSILHTTDSSESSVHQKYSLAPPLVDLHIDFQQTYFPLRDADLKSRQVLLLAPWEYPAETLSQIERWLAEDHSRVVVTHSFVPTRPCDGLALDVRPDIGDPLAAKGLGLAGLKASNVTTGPLETVDTDWNKTFDIAQGTILSFGRPLITCEGETVLKLGDHPLVTRVRGPRGGTVYYLNFTAPERYEMATDDSARLLRATMSQILRERHIKPQAEGSQHWACSRYNLSNGYAFFLLDRRQARQTRFTEESPSYEPVEPLALCLAPHTEYWIYDVLSETLGRKSTDHRGLLPVFLSGKSVRLLYVYQATGNPFLAFTTAGREDDLVRTQLPAKLRAHRAGTATVAGLTADSAVRLDGQLLIKESGLFNDRIRFELTAGEHQIEVVRKESPSK